MTARTIRKKGMIASLLAILIGLAASWAAGTAFAQQGAPATGVAAKRPVLQGACDHCPWGALANIVKAVPAAPLMIRRRTRPPFSTFTTSGSRSVRSFARYAS